MALAKLILDWMVAEDRTVGHLADKADLDAAALVDLIVGDAAPDADAVAALARATGLSAEDLTRDTKASPDAGSRDPARGYSVPQVAALWGVSPDTIRKEVQRGTLMHMVLADRVIRIPRSAIEARLVGPKNEPARPAADPAPPPKPRRRSQRVDARQLPLS